MVTVSDWSRRSSSESSFSTISLTSSLSFLMSIMWFCPCASVEVRCGVDALGWVPQRDPRLGEDCIRLLDLVRIIVNVL